MNNKRRKIWEWRGVLMIAPGVASCVILLRAIGLLQLLELSALDQFFRVRPQEKPDERIVIVGVEESDLERLKKWPVPDQILADLLEKIKKQKPRAIGLDIYRDLPVEPGHAKLKKLFETTPQLIGIQKVVGNGQDESVAPSPILARLGRSSANDFPWDVDGKIRRGFLYLSDLDKKMIYSLGFKLSLIYLEKEGIQPTMMPDNVHIKLGKAMFAPFSSNDGGYVGAADQGYQVLLNYRGPKGTFKSVSLSQVLDNKISPDLMRDKIVLIGSTAKSLKDYLLTPYSSNLVTIPEPMAGVEVHANIISQIIQGALNGRPLLRTMSEPWEWVWILSWSFVGATLTCHWRRKEGLAKISFSRTTGSILLYGGVLVGIVYVAFLNAWWVPVIPPLMTLVASTVVIMSYTLWENLKSSYRQIEEYSRTLEVKVEERTKELKYKNQQLDQTLQELKAAQKQMIAQEKLAFLGTLTAGIAHEIRNPLNFVKNFATISVDLTQELKEEIDNQSQQLEAESVEYIDEIFSELKDSIVEIEKQGQRIEGIILSMMMHAQKESGKREKINFKTLLSESIQLAYHSFKAKRNNFEIAMEKKFDEEVEEIEIVPQEISRAVVNIISNSCDAVYAKHKAKKEEFKPEILITTMSLKDAVKLIIRDNGQGIAPENLEKIFNPFFTTKPPGEGTGLGLSLTYEIIVGQHQGEIKVESVLDSHTEFIILLPKKWGEN
ncbi:CHASE2 domain-containing protein [Ancylothrix sp. C2]|uniref:CHASE2 domain-containing protein n=1 Tax=Ancylothrix sp. D3o TaxID=2953691 RepID=UPI0021BB0E92|nr:CHASE2 domain-containing protein [Ancylothrix sp. D3o]MCT7948625.1 CHASE2 domain-containing protein [Ancylothrix sp. D3o]